MSVGAERTENHRRWSSVVSEKWRMCAAATMLHSDQLKATEIKAGNKCIQSGLRHLHEEHPKANRRKKQRLPTPGKSREIHNRILCEFGYTEARPARDENPAKLLFP